MRPPAAACAACGHRGHSNVACSASPVPLPPPTAADPLLRGVIVSINSRLAGLSRARAPAASRCRAHRRLRGHTGHADSADPGTGDTERLLPAWNAAERAESADLRIEQLRGLPCELQPRPRAVRAVGGLDDGPGGRDPIFYATLAIANQDVDFGGEACLRCHAPGAWLDGRSTPTDGSSLDPLLGDLDGVNCHFCHRMVDPVPDAANPADDAAILAGLVTPALEEPHTGSFVIDPDDNRRGPFELVNFFFHQWRESPFHQESLMCATCHDVSNPLLESSRTAPSSSGTWTPPPDRRKQDMFPVERTFSEWAASVYAQDAIETGGASAATRPRCPPVRTATCRTRSGPGAIRTSRRRCVPTSLGTPSPVRTPGSCARFAPSTPMPTPASPSSRSTTPWRGNRQCCPRPRTSRPWWTAETCASASRT